MANDSPAKSLVDIDLASLRVSALEASNGFFPNPIFSNTFDVFSSYHSTRPPVLTLMSEFQPILLGWSAENDRWAMARCCQGLLFLCSGCIWHGAQQLAHPGQCRVLLKNNISAAFFVHTEPCFFSLFFFCFHSTGSSWDIRIGGGGWKWHLWTSIQGLLEAKAWPVFIVNTRDQQSFAFILFYIYIFLPRTSLGNK